MLRCFPGAVVAGGNCRSSGFKLTRSRNRSGIATQKNAEISAPRRDPVPRYLPGYEDRCSAVATPDPSHREEPGGLDAQIGLRVAAPEARPTGRVGLDCQGREPARPRLDAGEPAARHGRPRVPGAIHWPAAEAGPRHGVAAESDSHRDPFRELDRRRTGR